MELFRIADTYTGKDTYYSSRRKGLSAYSEFIDSKLSYADKTEFDREGILSTILNDKFQNEYEIILTKEVLN